MIDEHGAISADRRNEKRQRIDALSFSHRLLSCGKGKVHTILRSSVLIDFCGTHALLLNSGSCNVPYGIVLDIPESLSFRDLGIEKGDKTGLSGRELKVGDVDVDLTGAEMWRGFLTRDGALNDKEKIEENKRKLVKKLRERGNFNGIAGLIFGYANEWTGNFRVSALLKSIRDRDAQRLSDCFRHVVGLGPGLTPSCDDFLVGLLSTVQYMSDRAYTDVCRSLSSYLDRTTIVSAIMLRSVIEGEAPDIVRRVIVELCTGSIEESDTEKILGLGATSGSDITAGIIYGIDFWEENALGTRMRSCKEKLY